ncbi:MULTISPECIES: DUF3343 domain-containing protein [Clostridium]|jgi:hypothetical protein|uniref:Putative Se/S carrier protein-like domain-containing protein n=2 Tax=Clostridium TaxID=1485 RepID=A0A151ARC3_9CLOT|nr:MULTISPECIES: DUF3343 domain-containing protein [Clostridium]KYH30176.1 hypothetical protein CLCOL_01140 [Clostridium colicanis DSM 13634]MBE6044594.1 DUF3343 domain-containing protein [Clostridium thermopalmarium]PRR76673.1 hypothetical protein CPAL_00580 [Clostridium thermopalmarium DSM 5974]PVZ23008.1 uncharacterized protein DUF3343 [Clostridium thermopalmarium DSM 5974]
METVYIITFTSANSSLMLYKILKDARIKVTMIQTPCKLSAGCARSLEIKKSDFNKAVDIIKNSNIKIQKIYKRFINSKTRRYEYIEVSY